MSYPGITDPLSKIKERRLAWRLSGQESACQCRRPGLDPSCRKVPCALEQRALEPQPRSPSARAALEQPPPGGACLSLWGAAPLPRLENSPKKIHTSDLLKTKGKGKMGMAEGRKEEGQGTGWAGPERQRGRGGRSHWKSASERAQETRLEDARENRAQLVKLSDKHEIKLSV